MKERNLERHPPAFFAVRLNAHSKEGWAVVNRATGAIVLDDEKRLVMRLTAEQAEAQAERLSAEALGALSES